MRRIWGFNYLELALIGIVIATGFVGLATGIASGQAVFALIELAAVSTGILSVVLAAKGKRSGFIFGLVNAVAYSVISFSSAYYGEVMLNMLFYVPSNIVGFAVWRKNASRVREHEVQGRSMTWTQLIGSAAILLAATFAYQLVLRQLGGSMAMLDGFTTLASIFATMLMVSRFAEQWAYWIAVDIVTVALWVIAGDPIMTAMWGAYLANAVYGYLLWRYKAGKSVPFAEIVCKLAG